MSIESSSDPRAFADFEHQAWETVSHGYEAHFARLTSQSVPALLEAAGVGRGNKVLDLCCGPGMISAAAMARGAETLGIDFSSVAVEIAAANVPGADFRQGDAQSLPPGDDSFDAVLCGFGIIHLPDPAKALSEIRRVLRPGGRVALSTWEAPGPGNGFGLLFGAIKAHADMGVDLPHGPDFFQFSEAGKMTAALREAGFVEASARIVPQTWEFSDVHGFYTAMIEGSARARGLLKAQTDAVQATIIEAVVTGMDAYRVAGGACRIPMPALIGSAIK